GRVQVHHAVVPAVVVYTVVVEVCYVDGLVADVGYPDLAGVGVLGELDVYKGGDVRVLVVLAGEHVAEAVADEAGALVALGVLDSAQLHALRHAAVSANDDVRAVFKEEIGNLYLLPVGLRGKLGTPGHKVIYYVRARLPGA